MMNEPIISLCLAYPHYNNPDINILFRVADYFPEEDRMYAVPFYEEECVDTPKRIGAHPKDVYTGMTVLREWEYDTEEPGRTRSYSYSGNIYEIIFPKELDEIEYTDTNEIRKILCEGFSMNDIVSDNILIAIGKSGSHNAFLLCRKRDLKRIKDGVYAIHSNTKDMLHSVHCLEEYDIIDADIIDSSSCHISLPNGYRAPVRYFYSSTKLPERIGYFHPIDFKKYIPTFVSSYIKKNKDSLKFSLNDIRRITEMIESAIEDREVIKDFFKVTGYTDEQIAELLVLYKDVIVESLLEDTSIDAIIKKSLIENPEMQERYIGIVKDAWLAEQSEERQRVLGELSEIKKRCAECEADFFCKKKNLDEVVAEIFSAEENLSEKRKEFEKIQADIESELKEFSDNIVHSMTLRAVVQGTGVSLNQENNTEVDIFNLCPITDKEQENLDDYDDFQEALADNLILLGYDDEIADQMAQIIAYSISEKQPILLASNEDEVAKCIAAMFGTSVTVVNIVSGMNPVGYLTKVEQATEQKQVVLIHGAFAGFSNEHFNAIRYHFAEAGIVTLIALDGTDVSLISKNVYERTMYLESGYGFEYSSFKHLNQYVSDCSIFKREYKKEDVLKQQVKLNPFIEAGIINAISAANYAKFMAGINCNMEKDYLLVLQLCIQAKGSYKTDVMKEWLVNNNINADILNYYL